MTKGIFIFVLAIVFFLSSCSKKQNAEVDNETQSVLDFSTTSRDFIFLISSVHHALVNTPGTGANQNKIGLTACQALTKMSGDTLWATPGHINPTYSIAISNIITCNNQSFLFNNNNTLGEVFITLNDKLQNTGAITTIKIKSQWIERLGEAYSAPAYNLCDSITLKTVNSDANSAGFEANLVNGKIKQDFTAKVSKLTFNIKLQSYLSNVAAPYTAFYGLANGTNINDLPYKVTIGQDASIIKAKNCSYFESGKADIEPFGFKTRTVNYGSGSCDNNANFTVNGNTIAFKIK